MLLTAALVVFIVTPLVALLLWRRHHFSYFKRIGIPGPKPSIIWGNIGEYHSMPHYKVVEKWFQQYGDIFGFFNGDVPFVVLKDLDFIDYIFVRNFQNFTDRGVLMILDQSHPILGRSLKHERSPRWKSIRSALAQGFAGAKLKQKRTLTQEKWTCK
ncbi:hypothetical protein V5799_007179 [Amblyomma americanum]|uniref:Cytochrome n=1 Tax=Amblyomma americanum TaxID=6943 RepID=A0AAQ4DU98_AMBAM